MKPDYSAPVNQLYLTYQRSIVLSFAMRAHRHDKLCINHSVTIKWLMANYGKNELNMKILIIEHQTPCIFKLVLHCCFHSSGVKVAASSRRPRQPSSGRNQCNRQGNHPKARSPRPARAKDYLDRFFTKGRPISGCRLPSASSRRRHRNRPRTTLLRLW